MKTIKIIYLSNLQYSHGQGRSTHLDGGNATHERHDVAKHVISIEQQGKRVCDMTGNYFDNKESRREKKYKVQLNWLQSSKPLFYSHDPSQVRSVSRLLFDSSDILQPEKRIQRRINGVLFRFSICRWPVSRPFVGPASGIYYKKNKK